MTASKHHAIASLLLSMALLAPSTTAQAGPTFDVLTTRAEHLKSLGTFLKSYVGACKGDPFERRDCQTNVKLARKRFAGKLLHVRLSDSHGRLLRVLRELPSGALKVTVTPFFDAAGYGLSKDRAPKFDRRGAPRLRLLPFNVTLPDGLSARSFELQLRSGNVALELLFKVKKAWRVPRPGDEAAEGVAAKILGLKLSSARTGEVLAAVTW